MPTISFINQNLNITVASGTTILEAARAANIEIESPCSAVGTCGKCSVRLLDTAQLACVNDNSLNHLSQVERAAGYVLACHTEVYGDIDVIVHSKTDENRRLSILAEGESFDYMSDPFITKRADGGVTRVFGGGTLLGTEPGDTTEQAYGIALDIGTTTLVAELIHLPTGECLASESMLNPQSIYAQDVLTRIHFAGQEDGLQTLHETFLCAFASLRDSLIQLANINPRHVYEVVYSGNTTMLHLATGVDPTPLGK